MLHFFARLFSRNFMPHGACYLWDPAVLWLNVVSDGLIAASYYAIPFLLFRFAKSRRDIGFQWIFVAFGLFILACGSTHLMGVVTAWIPMYRLDGLIKAVTAAASLATFILLIPMLPQLLALPSPSQLALVNRRLEQEVEERRSAEEEVRRMNAELESRVEARTAELAQSESRFRHLAEAMPQIVWVSDGSGRTEYLNRRWYEYTGAAEQLPDAAQEAIHPEDRPRVMDLWERSVRSGEPFEVEYRLRRRDGEYHWHLGRTSPVRDGDGRVVRWFGTATDIDEHKRHANSLADAVNRLQAEIDRRHQLEDQLLQSQKMEAVGQLAGGVAHDFNNLLTAILGYAEILREEVGSSRGKEFLEEVVRAGERASALTNQLLAFSRRQVAQPRVVDLNNVVSSIEKMLRRIIGDDVVLKTRLQSGLPAVKVDPSHIDQVIMNLAVNARDAMPHGGTLTVETSSLELSQDSADRYLEMKPGRYVLLAVSDTGQGMDAETRTRIFEPFFTTKGPGKGTGLGLSIVYGIVKQNGGEILVYSEPGRGATFKVYLPTVTPADVGREAGPAAGVPVGGSETVLLVEDEDMVRKLARTMLARQGYRVLDAASGAEALDILRRSGGEVRILLTDVVMPGMGGVELAEAAVAIQPDLKVLYMSGYAEGGIVHQGVLDSDMEFLQKPFSEAALAAKVREVLDR